MASGNKRPRFCTSCGTKLGETVKFCPDCGTAVMAAEMGKKKPAKKEQTENAPSLISRVGGPIAAFGMLMSDKKLRRVLIAALVLVVVAVAVIVVLLSGGRHHSSPPVDWDDDYTVEADDTQQDNGETNSPSVSGSAEKEAVEQNEKQSSVWEEQAEDPAVLPYLMDVDSSSKYYLADETPKLKIRFETGEADLYTVAEEYVALLEQRGYTAELTEAYDLPAGWYGDVKLWTLRHPQVEGNAYVRYECYRDYDQCYIDFGWDGEISLAKKFLRPTGDPAVLPSFDRYDPTTCFFEANESGEGKAVYKVSRYEGYQTVVDYVEALEQYGWNEVDSNHVIYNDADIGVVSSWELRNKDVKGTLRVNVEAWKNDDRCHVTFTMPQSLQMEDFSLNHGTVDVSDSGDSGDDNDFFDKCSACHGSGRCTHCGGDDEVKKFQAGLGWVEQNCTFCTGGRCRHCGGDGKA